MWKNYKCIDCNIICVTAGDYNLHLKCDTHDSTKIDKREIIDNTPRHWICEDCGKLFTVKKNYWTHRKSKKYKEEYCGLDDCDVSSENIEKLLGNKDDVFMKYFHGQNELITTKQTIDLLGIITLDVMNQLNAMIGEEKSTMKAISLFSGMGGDSLGIHNSNIDLVAYSEIEKEFQKTHELNFPNCKLIGDGSIVDISDNEFKRYKGEVNLIFAGFPCQGFSQAGKKLPDDPRNTLFREFLRATNLIQPNYIIGENVKGLLTRETESGELFIAIIQSEFEKSGYDIYTKVMKCNLYGIPQNRHRLIIVGIKKELKQTFNFPEEQDDSMNLQGIVTFSMEGAIKIEPEDFDMKSIPDECILKDMNNEEDEVKEGDNKPHPNLKLLAKDKDYEYKGDIYSRRIHFGKRIPVGGEIIDIRKPLNTIICTYARQPRFFVPLQNKKGYYLRCLLPDELKQIQGFPADYNIYGSKARQIVQIGNAVPPPLIELIIQSLQIHTKT